MTAPQQPSYLNAASVAHALGGRASGNQIQAPAPGHSAADRSLSVLLDANAPDGFLVNTHAGEDSLAMRDYVRGKLGLAPWAPGVTPEPVRVVSVPKPSPKPFSDTAILSAGYRFVCAYSYADADGVEAFEVCRYEHPTKGKTFLQRHTDEAGRVMSGRGEAILYRLHEIASRPGEPIFFVEGEKDSDNLAALGFLATTVPNNSWPTDLQVLEGRTVYILADNDAAGVKLALKAEEQMAGAGAKVQHIKLPNLPEKGDVTDWLDAGGTAEALQSLCDRTAKVGSVELVAANGNSKIKATPFVLRDTSLIPRREWLFGQHYARKYLTATFGAGGGGKSANVVSEALAMVTGRPLLGGERAKPISVWYLNLEDPAVEIERRFAGAAKHFNVTAEQIGGRLFTDSGRDQAFVVMTMDGRGTKVCEPVVAQLIEEIIAREIDVLIVDPFVSTHEVEENDNSKIQQVAALWVRIADQTNCSVELIHHVTKGNLEITADSGRGAGALKDKARSVRVINPMAEAQATSAGIPPEDAPGYFRIEMGKANLTKGGGKPVWRRFASVGLDNGPKLNGRPFGGDSIGVVEPWEWPTAASLVEDVPAELLDGLKARMGAGNYRESEQSADWAGYLVADLFGMDSSTKAEKGAIKRMLTAWIADGHFKIEDRLDSKRMPKKHIAPVFAAP